MRIFLGHLVVDLGHDAVARGFDQGAMEPLVELGHLPGIDRALADRRMPDCLQLGQAGRSSAWHRRSTAVHSSRVRSS